MMKLPRRSLAYVVGKRSLRGNEPRWLPAIYLAISAYGFARAYYGSGSSDRHVAIGLIFACCAYESWLQRGMQEAHRELEAELEQEKAPRLVAGNR